MTIKAKIIQHSISEEGKEIATFELEDPRFIHGEFLTHRIFSRNSASSRAIPIKIMNQYILDNPAEPIHWGKNQAGMQAGEELTGFRKTIVKLCWHTAKYLAVNISKLMSKLGAHKQVANRLTEPFQHMKIVLTATELDNFFELRLHKDAQPEIQELAKQMYKELINSKPMEIKEDEWHLPYITRTRTNDGKLLYLDGSGNVLSLDQAKIISASCCAQVSYRKNDESLEKAYKIYKMLIESEPRHASPVEHQATPIKRTQKFIQNLDGKGEVVVLNLTHDSSTWQEGITHVDRLGNFWSGNFKGWVQNRQLLD